MALMPLLLPILAQTSFVPPPAPPALPRAGSEAFERDKADFETDLRRSCLSDAGIRIVVADWAAKRNATARPGRGPNWRQLDQNVAEAVYADPLDMKRLEQAMRVQAEHRAQRERDVAEEGIATLQKLTPADRIIYARRFTFMQPASPARTCGVAAR